MGESSVSLFLIRGQANFFKAKLNCLNVRSKKQTVLRVLSFNLRAHIREMTSAFKEGEMQLLITYSLVLSPEEANVR